MKQEIVNKIEILKTNHTKIQKHCSKVNKNPSSRKFNDSDRKVTLYKTHGCIPKLNQRNTDRPKYIYNETRKKKWKQPRFQFNKLDDKPQYFLKAEWKI